MSAAVQSRELIEACASSAPRERRGDFSPAFQRRGESVTFDWCPGQRRVNDLSFSIVADATWYRGDVQFPALKSRAKFKLPLARRIYARFN
jgi:hypothetical protein